MSKVFINYRTGDEEISASLIEGELSRRFGSENIFRASKSIQPGDDFERVILRAVRRSDVLLAVIGPGWLSATDGQGGRRIDDEADWTRREILEAFGHDVRVIPVLLGPVPRLAAEALPPELAQLARCQYVRMHYRDMDTDMRRLADRLMALVPDLKPAPTARPRPSARPGDPGGAPMNNYADGHAHVGVQGIVHGNVTSGDASPWNRGTAGHAGPWPADEEE